MMMKVDAAVPEGTRCVFHVALMACELQFNYLC